MSNFLFLLASAIATQEGWFAADPRVAPRRNNNPGNLEFAGQLGAKPAGRFASFDTPQRGIAALYRQLAKRIQEGVTLRQLLDAYAPATENDTSHYISETARRVGVDADRPLWMYLTLERIG